jgi:kinesin family protein 1
MLYPLLYHAGQTGSGKTFTMMGRMTKDDVGIIPRLCRDLLEAVFHNSNAAVLNNGINGGNALTALTPAPVIEVGYYEIYNEKIFDLLSPEENSVCRIREHAAEGVYVEGLRLEPVVRYADVSRVLEQGMMKRQTASTLMNATSSRSHAVFTIFIKQTLEIPLPPEEGKPSSRTTSPAPTGADTTKFKKTTIERKSKVCLIDLAGSERINSTGATGDRLKEATKINQSLSTLGDVIRALSEQSQTDEKFVPYRNSALTWILKDSLGGNSKTTMLATISPIDMSFAESMNTLRYVERAKLIVNKVVVNDDNSNDPYIKHLQAQVTAYKGKLNAALMKMKLREAEYHEHIRQRQKEFDKLQAELSRSQLHCSEVCGPIVEHLCMYNNVCLRLSDICYIALTLKKTSNNSMCC